jgi:hypothetical protein
MAKMMIKPDVVFDGQELSAVTRLLEAVHNRKEIGVDKKALEGAKQARYALELNAPVAEDDLKNLVKAAKAYAKAVEDDKLESVPNVKGIELKKLLKKLEGVEKAEETKDEEGNPVHPAAMPVGDEHKEDEKGSTNTPKEGTDVPKLKADEDKKKK